MHSTRRVKLPKCPTRGVALDANHILVRADAGQQDGSRFPAPWILTRHMAATKRPTEEIQIANCQLRIANCKLSICIPRHARTARVMRVGTLMSLGTTPPFRKAARLVNCFPRITLLLE